jgi:hypothetical protein
MANIKAPLIGVSFAATLSCVFCPSICAQEQLSKAVRAAHDIFLRGYARSNNDCEALDPPDIVIDRPPEHGIVCLRRGNLKLQRTVENNLVHCLGKKVIGVHVIYVAQNGYVGKDSVLYTVRFPTVQHSVEATLMVLPNDGKVPARMPADNPLQTTGLAPSCPALVS